MKLLVPNLDKIMTDVDIKLSQRDDLQLTAQIYGLSREELRAILVCP